MKKLTTSILIILFAVGFTFAQAPNKKIVKKASASAQYVSGKMSLDEAKTSFLQATIVEKMTSSAEKTKGLSKEEKKPINKKIRKEFQNKLKEQFSNEEITKIKEYLKEYQQMKKGTTEKKPSETEE